MNNMPSIQVNFVDSYCDFIVDRYSIAVVIFSG
jgi:hypothetical protein